MFSEVFKSPNRFVSTSLEVTLITDTLTRFNQHNLSVRHVLLYQLKLFDRAETADYEAAITSGVELNDLAGHYITTKLIQYGFCQVKSVNLYKSPTVRNHAQDATSLDEG